MVKNVMSSAIATDSLSAVFSALADPSRREILGQLSRGIASVTDLARPHKMSLPAVSKHLRVLERSGLIERGRRAQWRPCRIHAKPLKEAVDWIGQYREHWEQSFQRLDELLEEMKAAEAKTSQKTKP
jgi:DNA-binding transcriptional ArsR family regulator